MTSDCIVASGVADVRREPDPTSELVTQALMNRPLVADGTHDKWTHVTLSDYKGWMRTNELEVPMTRTFCKIGAYCSTPLQMITVITTTRTPLYTQQRGEATQGHVYLSTRLPLLDTSQPERVQVALPGARTAWLARSAIGIRQHDSPYPRTPLTIITTYARAFLDVPYLWGGTSCEGIDCSGLVQLCYRMGGYTIPRDGDQQYDFLPHVVERGAMQEGDLVFFGSKAITHVAMALNAHEYIHAEGQNYDRVIINSFNPTDPHYYERLDHVVWGIRRVVV